MDLKYKLNFKSIVYVWNCNKDINFEMYHTHSKTRTMYVNHPRLLT